MGEVTSDESCARRGTSVQYILFATVSSHLVLPSAAFLQTRLVLLHVLLTLQLQPPLAAYEMHSRLRHVSCACVRVGVGVGVRVKVRVRDRVRVRVRVRIGGGVRVRVRVGVGAGMR